MRVGLGTGNNRSCQQQGLATAFSHFFLLLRIVLHWYSFFHDQLLKMPTIREVRNLAPALVLVLACVWPLVREIDVVRDLDAVEFHCGQKAITKAITSAGLQCLGLDILQGPEQDICSDLGLAAHLTAVMRTKAHGLLWTAQELSLIHI